MRYLGLAALSLLLGACGQSVDGDSGDIANELASYDHLQGFVDMYWDDEAGRIILKIEQFDEAMIYQSGLARGVGSNDLGLDRGQPGETRIVEFQRSGPRILLVQNNLGYRAASDNLEERQAVHESFARSVLWGFESLGKHDGAYFVDATEFVTRDSHGIAAILKEMEEGEYAVDPSRSAVYMPRTKAFPDNSEIESIVTLAGTPTGEILKTVVPDPGLITVHTHHSFIRLPDDGYEPLPHDPRSGVISWSIYGRGFADYATEIGDSLMIEFGRRHRLAKKDPTARTSEAVEPIVYYIDRGVPEPVHSALVDGAMWWNQAFEAAGYKDAFRVELLPEDADPLDVRYNVIQWIHRSTRGWSYGFPVMDPRTGEIIKGQVSLGSLRVRQDYLIAEGLLAPYEDESVPDTMLEMSLARIRQLAAHEVGHTLGIEHNFAASTQDRASVMDYPFPLIGIDESGELDLSDAYDVGIGAWDKRVILYAYQDFSDGIDANAERQKILAETVANYKYVADDDARATGTSHPDGNLWDNGEDAIAELRHLLNVRETALARFSERNIRIGRPMATLEEVLVPLYLIHRYQVRAVSKLIGGEYFNYALRGDGQTVTSDVPAPRQRAALDALISTIDPAFLRLPDGIAELIPPRPAGYAKSRETFPGATGINFDSTGPAASAAALTLAALLDASRGARMIEQQSRDAEMPGFAELCESLLDASWYATRRAGTEGLIQRRTNTLVLQELMRLSVKPEASPEVRATAGDSVNTIDGWLSARTSGEPNSAWRALFADSRLMISRFRDDPAVLEQIPPVVVPPGSPIGTGRSH
jgi:hypothetical protein